MISLVVIIYIMQIKINPQLTAHSALFIGQNDSQQTRGLTIDLPPEIIIEPKSHKKAFALSVFLPGLGEHYMGYKKEAFRGYIIETSIWTSFIYIKWYANVIKKDYILYAYEYADAKKNQEDDYYDAVEWYKNLDEYHIAVREEARAKYPDDREKQQQYIKDHSYPDSLKWEWFDEENWNKYRKLKTKRRNVLQLTSYLVGSAILNRIVSGIIASQLPEHGLGFKIENNGIFLVFNFK